MLKTLVDCSPPGWQLKGSDSKCWQCDLLASVSATDERSGSGRGGREGGGAGGVEEVRHESAAAWFASAEKREISPHVGGHCSSVEFLLYANVVHLR